MRADFAVFLASSLDVLAAEAPAAYEAVGRALDHLPVRVEVDGRASVLAFAEGVHRIEADGRASVLLRTGRPAILDLVAGRLTLLAALRSERLWLQGSPRSLVRVDEALRIYLAGAVRSPGFVPLLHAYRGAAPRGDPEELR